MLPPWCSILTVNIDYREHVCLVLSLNFNALVRTTTFHQSGNGNVARCTTRIGYCLPSLKFYMGQKALFSLKNSLSIKFSHFKLFARQIKV